MTVVHIEMLNNGDTSSGQAVKVYNQAGTDITSQVTGQKKLIIISGTLVTQAGGLCYVTSNAGVGTAGTYILHGYFAAGGGVAKSYTEGPRPNCQPGIVPTVFGPNTGWTSFIGEGILTDS